ncbi:MAG: twin-arginine translocase subunit TatC [Planctomycetota bacterium]
MSFGEHLEELRKVLIRSLIGIAVGCVFGFLVAEKVVNYLQVPLENALTSYYIKDAKKNLRAEQGYLQPEYQSRLEELRLIPETVWLDPNDLQELLAKLNPQWASASKDIYYFSPEDVSGEQALDTCRRWEELDSEDESKIAQWKYLKSILSTEERNTLESLAGKPELSQPQIDQFVAMLNRLISEPQLSDAEEFDQLIRKSNRSIADLLTPQTPNLLNEMKASLAQQFNDELSARLNRSLIAKTFEPDIFDYSLDLQPMMVWKSANYQSQSLGTTEPFMIWLKAAIVTGLVIASPWVFFQIWSFVAAGLYPSEQKYVYFFLPVSLGLFFAGASLAFFFVFEPVLDFLFSFNARMGIAPQPRINDWLSFVLFLPLGFGVAFQLPLVMLFANRIELVTVETFTSNWRVAVIAIFAISMLLTPADPVSMILLAIPLTFLYFLGIVLCYRLNKPSNPFAEA